MKPESVKGLFAINFAGVQGGVQMAAGVSSGAKVGQRCRAAETFAKTK